MTVLPRTTTAGLGLLLACSALGGAWVAETQFGLVPCAICLMERWPYRVLAVLCALALTLRALRRATLGAGAVVMLGALALGVVHVGVEQHWWPSPLPECAASSFGGGTVSERLARMPDRPAKPCDEPIWLAPGLSFARLQALAALAIAAMLATSVRQTERRHEPDDPTR